MVEQVSPLEPVWKPGVHGRVLGGHGVTLTETRPGSIVQIAAWPGEEKTVMATIKVVSGLALADGGGAGIATETRSAFGIAPGKFLVVDQAEDISATYQAALTAEIASVTDLSHGRTAIRVSGPRAEWIMAKFFAIDFSTATFPLGSGISTAHHDIFAQVQRTGADQFDIYVFRSFARAFWTALCHASGEVGYEVR